MELIHVLFFLAGAAVASLLCGFVGLAIGKPKGEAISGFLLGALFGPIGWLISAFSVGAFTCPECGGSIPENARRCRHCGIKLGINSPP